MKRYILLTLRCMGPQIEKSTPEAENSYEQLSRDYAKAEYSSSRISRELMPRLSSTMEKLERPIMKVRATDKDYQTGRKDETDVLLAILQNDTTYLAEPPVICYAFD